MILCQWFASLGLDWLVPEYPESRVCLNAIRPLNLNTFNVLFDIAPNNNYIICQ